MYTTTETFHVEEVRVIFELAINAIIAKNLEIFQQHFTLLK